MPTVKPDQAGGQGGVRQRLCPQRRWLHPEGARSFTVPCLVRTALPHSHAYPKLCQRCGGSGWMGPSGQCVPCRGKGAV